MSSFLHLLFDIVIISGVTRVLIQGGIKTLVTYNRMSCAYSTATRYVLAALLSLWEGL